MWLDGSQGCRFAPTAGLKLANAFGVLTFICTWHSRCEVVPVWLDTRRVDTYTPSLAPGAGRGIVEVFGRFECRIINQQRSA
jgi:hypothetical protein